MQRQTNVTKFKDMSKFIFEVKFAQIIKMLSYLAKDYYLVSKSYQPDTTQHALNQVCVMSNKDSLVWKVITLQKGGGKQI